MIEDLLVRWGTYIFSAILWAIVLVVGMGLVVDGHERHTVAKQLRTTPTTATNAISPSNDVVECHGTVHPHPDHGTLDAPFSDTKSLYTDWEVEVWKGQGGMSIIDEGTDHVPFLLDDGAGQTEVDPDGFERVYLSSDLSPASRSFLGDLPETATEYITNHVDTSDTYLRLTCDQLVLKPGDEVYVYGHPEHTTDGPANTAVRNFPEDSSNIAVLSDFSRQRLHFEAVSGWVRICYGAILSILTLLIGLAVFDLVSYSWPLLTLLTIILVSVGLIYNFISGFCRKMVT